MMCGVKLLIYPQMGMEKHFHLNLLWAYDYLSTLRLKLIDVDEMGPRCILLMYSPMAYDTWRPGNHYYDRSKVHVIMTSYASIHIRWSL